MFGCRYVSYHREELFCGDPLDDDDPYGSLTNGDYDYDHDG